MSRIAATFEALKAQGRKALIPYVTAGFPFADVTPELMHAMVAGGADVIELGVPFSDPSADGPVIQKAGDKALAQGIGMVQVLTMVRRFREQDQATPVVLMGYANPVERYNQKHDRRDGKSGFVADAAAAGVDGGSTTDPASEPPVSQALNGTDWADAMQTVAATLATDAATASPEQREIDAVWIEALNGVGAELRAGSPAAPGDTRSRLMATFGTGGPPGLFGKAKGKRKRGGTKRRRSG